MRQDNEVFFDAVTDVIEDDGIYFDTFDDINFSDPPSSKKHSSPKQYPVIRRSKRVKKKNTRLYKEDWILSTPSQKSKYPLIPTVDNISSVIKYDNIGFT